MALSRGCHGNHPLPSAIDATEDKGTRCKNLPTGKQGTYISASVGIVENICIFPQEVSIHVLRAKGQKAKESFLVEIRTMGYVEPQLNLRYGTFLQT